MGAMGLFLEWSPVLVCARKIWLESTVRILFWTARIPACFLGQGFSWQLGPGGRPLEKGLFSLGYILPGRFPRQNFWDPLVQELAESILWGALRPKEKSLVITGILGGNLGHRGKRVPGYIGLRVTPAILPISPVLGLTDIRGFHLWSLQLGGKSSPGGVLKGPVGGLGFVCGAVSCAPRGG